MGEIWRFTWYDIRRLLTSPRFYVSLFVVYACLHLFYGNVGFALAEYGETLQATELFTFACTNRLPQWIITFGILLLLGDAPFLHEGLSIYLIRSNRFRWLMGQILFCLITVIGYLMIIAVMLLSMSGAGVSFADQWSDMMLLVTRITSGASLLYIDMAVDFPISIISNGTPYGMFALTFLYTVLMLMLFSLLCLAFNTQWRTGVGCLGVVAMLVLRFLIDTCGILTELKMVSPCNLAAVSSRTVTPATVGYTVLYFTCFCALLGIWGYHIIQKLDLQGGRGE